MIAIVDIAGQQFKVAKDQKFYVNRLKGEAGSIVEFSEVLLLDNEGTVTIGTPLVEGAKVSVTILAHLRGDKVKIFKKKRRKGYKRKVGHRQQLTVLRIASIG
jgi:large subunit ribosomal protein L21